MPKLIVIEGPMKGLSFELADGTIFVGRSSKNDIQIKDETISRKQLKIFRIGNKFFAEDLKSTNGTSINSEKIIPGEGYELSEGDAIAMGKTILRLAEVSAGDFLNFKNSLIHTSNQVANTRGRMPEERRAYTSRNIELISRMSELLRQSLSVGEIFEKLLEYLMETLPRIDRAAILLYDNDKGDIKEVISKSRHDPWDEAVRYSRSVVARVLQEGKAIRMSNTDYEAAEDFSESMRSMGIGSAMCVPIISNSEMRGAIYVDSIRGPHGFRRDDLLLLNSLSGPVAVAIENDLLSSRFEEPASN